MAFGPANVIWHSSPGDCLFSYRHDYAGADPGPDRFTIPVPVLSGASPATALFLFVSAANGDLTAASIGHVYVDALGDRHQPTVIPSSYDEALHVNYGANNGGISMVAFGDVGTAGGYLEFYAGTYHLNFITGIIDRVANGVAIACAADIGPQGVLTAGGVGPNGPTALDAIRFFSRGADASPIVTVADATSSGLVIAGVGALGTSLTGVVNSPGWSDIVLDIQPNIVPSRAWSRSGAALSVYDPTTLPDHPTCQWGLSSAQRWVASAGILWIPGGSNTRNRGFAQVVG